MQDNSKQIVYCHIFNGCYDIAASFSNHHPPPVKPGHMRLVLGRFQSFSSSLHLALPWFVTHCSFVFICVMQDSLNRLFWSASDTVSLGRLEIVLYNGGENLMV